MSFQMLVRGKPCSAHPEHPSVFVLIYTLAGYMARFAGLSFESKHTSIALCTRSYHDGTLKMLFLQMQGFDMSLQMRFTQEALIAVFWISCAFVRPLAGVGPKVLLETTWTDEGFITTRMGTSMYFSIISTINSNWWVMIKDSPFSRVGFDFFAGDAVADTEARFFEGGIYSSAACVVSFALLSILN